MYNFVGVYLFGSVHSVAEFGGGEVHLSKHPRIEALQQCRGWGACASDISLLHYIHVATDWLTWVRYPARPEA